MSTLPRGWTSAPIGDLCALKNGRAFKSSEWESSGIPIVRIQNLNNPHAKFNHFNGQVDERHQLAGGELLFAWSGTPGTSFGAHVWKGGKAALNQHIFRVDFDRSELELRFFRYAINQKIDELIGVAHGGAGLQHVTKGKFEATQVWLPPFPEQARIADKLDILLARVGSVSERLARVPALLKRFRQSVLEVATSGELTADWRGSEEAKWKHLRAADICAKVQSGGTPKEGFTEPGIPFLKVYNIVDQKILFEYRPQYIAAPIHTGSMAKSITTPGDVLMNIVGPPLGKVAIVPNSHPEWNINQAITLFRPSEIISTGWLYCVLCNGKNIEDIILDTKGMVGQQNISLSQCRDFIFPVPTRKEQDEIVQRVEALFTLADKVQAQYEAARARVDRLTSALLAKAFRGELVPQDPNDEPASVLLERLQAGKASAPKPVKKSRKSSAPVNGALGCSPNRRGRASRTLA